MPSDYSLNVIARWASYHLARGTDAAELTKVAASRFPGVAASDVQASIQEGLHILEVTDRIRVLDPRLPLRTILAGETPPSDSVFVNARVTLVERNTRGKVVGRAYREVQWRGSWDVPYEAVIADLASRGQAIAKYKYVPGLGVIEVESIEIDSTIWFPHPSQL